MIHVYSEFYVLYLYYITVNFFIEWNENRRFENAAVTKKIINCENTLKPRKRKLSVVKENATKYAHFVLFSKKISNCKNRR